MNPAAFTRLAQALGYRGWDELRDALIEARRPSMEAPFSRRIEPAGGPGREPEAMAAAVIGSDAAGLSRVHTTPIAMAARALHAPPRAWIAGFRSCRAVAELLHYQLRMFRPGDVHLVDSVGGIY